jgi:hypothetical protein
VTTKTSTATDVLSLIGMIGMMAAYLLGSAWALMLTVGVAHHDWWPNIPPISYTTALTLTAILFAVKFAGGAIAGISKAGTK